MHSIYAFLAIVLIQTLSASAVEARGSALSWVSPCTLDVVLVTFQDATTSADGYDYHLQDRPHGSNDGGAYPDPDSSYTLRDFERLFSGGYDGLPDFVGTNQTVGAGHTLPEVFGQCAGVLRFAIKWGVPTACAHDQSGR